MKKSSQLLKMASAAGALSLMLAACDRDAPLPEVEPEPATLQPVPEEASSLEELGRETKEAAQVAGRYLSERAQDAGATLGETWDRVRNATYDERRYFQRAAGEALDKLERDSRQWREKAAEQSREALARTENLRREAAEKIGKLKEAGADAWPELRDAAREAINDLKDALDRARGENPGDQPGR